MQVTPSSAPGRVPFTELIDLASAKVGGKAIYANDDFFAEKDNLLKPEAPVFIVGKYTDNGKWMDGWESRRKRVPGYDHCIIKLGLPGQITGVNIDTSFFVGNFPEYASIDACEMPENSTHEQLQKAEWKPILSKSGLHGGTQNYFFISHPGRVTHLRLNIFPDGGVARLRVHGIVKPSAEHLKGTIDVAAAANGATVVTCNDHFFGAKEHLIYPGRAEHMGEGWETRRKRGPGFDWIIIKLAGNAQISKVEVDTHHFKGNFPDRCSMEAISLPANGTGANGELLACDFRDRNDIKWTEILPQQKLSADNKHVFEKELIASAIGQKYNYVKLNIYPDGGVSRLRIYGEL